MKLHPFNLLQRSACAGITMGSVYSCDNPIAAGVNQQLILMDKDVYDRATITEALGVITNIVLSQTGDAAYSFQGTRKSLNPQSAFVPSTVSIGYDHQVDFLIFDISSTQKHNIESMAAGRMVAIIQNTNAVGNTDSVFEVFGKDVGMEVQAGPMRINGDLESAGAYTIILKTSDDSGKEPKLPTSFWDTDFTTTEAKVQALLIPVV